MRPTHFIVIESIVKKKKMGMKNWFKFDMSKFSILRCKHQMDKEYFMVAMIYTKIT